jgi:hypothetical protein
MPAELVSDEGSLVGLEVAIFSLSLHYFFFVYYRLKGIFDMHSSFYKDTSLIQSGPHPNDLI